MEKGLSPDCPALPWPEGGAEHWGLAQACRAESSSRLSRAVRGREREAVAMHGAQPGGAEQQVTPPRPREGWGAEWHEPAHGLQEGSAPGGAEGLQAQHQVLAACDAEDVRAAAGQEPAPGKGWRGAGAAWGTAGWRQGQVVLSYLSHSRSWATSLPW